MRFSITVFGTPYKQWDIISGRDFKYGLVVNIFSSSQMAPENSETTYQIKVLNTSKWSPIRKIQLWAVKKLLSEKQ